MLQKKVVLAKKYLTDPNCPHNPSEKSYCEAYEDYVVPLLESSQLKPNSEVPELYELLGMDQATFQQYVDLMERYKAGEVDINGNPI